MSSTRAVDHAPALNQLRLLSRRRPDLTPADQGDQIGLYAVRLATLDPRDVAAALSRTWRWWPDWHELEEAVHAASAERKAAYRARLGHSVGDMPSLTQAVNVAFSFLDDAHLRLLDTLEPGARQRIVRDCAEWFRPHAADAVRASTPAERRQFGGMVAEFVERRMGKAWKDAISRAVKAPPAADQGPGAVTIAPSLENAPGSLAGALAHVMEKVA